jgi:hypothetical protein
MKVFTMHKLKHGASIEDYKRWSQKVDQPKTNSQVEINKFEVYEILGSLDSNEKKPEYDIIEVVEVQSVEDIRRVEERLQDFLNDEWIAEWVEQSTLINLYGERI